MTWTETNPVCPECGCDEDHCTCGARELRAVENGCETETPPYFPCRSPMG
jgi:hypothetical protein